MDTFHKVSNVFGVIFAWLLSIVLVVMLIVSPMVLSALSMLRAEMITKVVSEALTAQTPAEDDRAAEPAVTLLSEDSQQAASSELPDEYEQAGGNFLSGIFGDQLKQEDIQKILSSDLVKDFVRIYTDSMADALTGKPTQNAFDAEAIKAFANAHVDDIVEIAIQIVPQYAEKDTEEVKAMIRKLVDENVEELAKALPKPEELVNNLLEESPELEILLQIIARRKAIKWAIVGAIAVLGVLIFLCRLPGLRGFRWLATDLFVGSGFGIVICVALLVGRNPLLGMMDKQVAGIVGSLLSVFSTGVIVRTVVMLVFAVALLVAYIFLKKRGMQPKTAVQELPDTENKEAAADAVCAESVEEETPVKELAAETDA